MCQISPNAPGKIGNDVEIDGDFAFENFPPLPLHLALEEPLRNDDAKKEGQGVNQIPVVGPSLGETAMKKGMAGTLHAAAGTIQAGEHLEAALGGVGVGRGVKEVKENDQQ